MIEAERVIREHGRAALVMMVFEIMMHADEILELAVERATTLGVAEYGDASFHKTPKQLRRERFEEYGDGAFYGSVEINKTGG